MKILYIISGTNLGGATFSFLTLLEKGIEQGNSVVMIEHNLDVICQADYIIDLGPEGGFRGGTILTTGTPEEVAECKESHTGKFIKEQINRSYL